MKRVFILFFLSVITFGYAQTPILEPGVYKSNTRGQEIMLRISEDNQFEMAVLYGKYLVQNDTITFKNGESNQSGFKIKINKEAPFSSTFKIKFVSESFAYASYNIYIGTQKEDNAVIEYKSVMDYIQKSGGYPRDRKKGLKIDVEKTKYLYFVESNKRDGAIVSKFQIDPSANELEVDYNMSSLNNIELKGIYDKETKKLSVREGRKSSPIFDFVMENAVMVEPNAINPVAIQSEKDWLKNNGFANEDEFDSSYMEKRNIKEYNFKLPVLKTYAEAVKSIEKTPEKYLVIVVDDSKKGQTYFGEFIKEKEKRLSRYMRREYDPKKDNFNYYLATEKDKSLLDKFKVKDKTSLIFVNSKGEMLYHVAGSLDDNSNLFELYYSVYDEIKRVDTHIKLDQLVANKKATLADFKKALANVVKTKKNFNDYAATEVIADSTAVDVTEDYYDAAATAVDTVAVAAYAEDDEGDYFQVENPEDLYALKTPKETIVEKWKQLVDFYSKNETYDEDFVAICKKELTNKGFSYKLFGSPKSITETDFKILDYLYKHYDTILKSDKDQGIEPRSYGFGRGNNLAMPIASVLSYFFRNPYSDSVPVVKSNQIKLMGYYKTFLKISGYKLGDFNHYLANINEVYPNDYTHYFKEYDEFFQAIDSKNASLIETLDEMYTAQEESYEGWSNFKESFFRQANNVAWQVVETKNKDVTTIQKAIKWSEASVKAYKTEYRYLDTLGQLYYKNQEKEKAIITQQKAIDNIPSEEKSTLEEYKEVLERMKNGTY